MEEELFNKTRDDIVIHESKLLKIIDFNLEIPVPYPILDKIMQTYFSNSQLAFIKFR
jgi:hypothetical protein